MCLFACVIGQPSPGSRKCKFVLRFYLSAGAGKSTLATELAKLMDLPCHYEPVLDNEYLADFYRDPSRYSFPLQVCITIIRVMVLLASDKFSDMRCSLSSSLSVDMGCELFVRTCPAAGLMSGLLAIKGAFD